MRLLVMFDLPTGNKEERKSYSAFRKFLVDDGYQMEQFSIYSRVLLSRESLNSHMERLNANLPRAGSVFVLELTEKQYESRKILVNKCTGKKPAALGAQMTLVF